MTDDKMRGLLERLREARRACASCIEARSRVRLLPRDRGHCPVTSTGRHVVSIEDDTSPDFCVMCACFV